MKKKPKKIAIIGLAIIILVIAIVVLLIFKNKTIDSNSNLVNTIYTYIGNNDLQVCKGLITYDKDKVTYDDIDLDVKICNAYSLIDSSLSKEVKIDKAKKNHTCSIDGDIVFAPDGYEKDICTLSRIDAKLVKDKFKEVYGKELEELKSFQFDNTTICHYSKKDDSYYCGLSETYTYSVGAEQNTYRSISKAEDKGEYIYIYDYFLKTIDKKCYTTFTGTVENTKCTNNYTSNIKYKFLKKYGTLYKHTFKNDGNDNYYWISSQPER